MAILLKNQISLKMAYPGLHHVVYKILNNHLLNLEMLTCRIDIEFDTCKYLCQSCIYAALMCMSRK